VLAGRAFSEGRTPGVREVIIDRSLAEWFYPRGNAIGGQMRLDGVTRTIVGVVEHARQYDVHKDGRMQAYIRNEDDPYASLLFVSALSCSLVGQTMSVRLDPGSRAAELYGADEATERYYCNFGLNPEHQDRLHDGGFRVAGTDQDGEARVLELPGHRFYIATLFVPHTSSSADEPHPLISAYVAESAGVAAANASAASRSKSP